MAEAKQGWFSRVFSSSGKHQEARKVASPSTSWAVGQRLLDDYVIERELGAGGMGKVYLVRSESNGQQFAVKKTRTLDTESRRKFLTELQTWIDLPEHPHLAACRFFRTIGDEVVIFAEYVAGGSLADWIADGRVRDLKTLLDIAIQFAWGLHAAHERGLVHQDVKPANVLMTKDGVVKVADFGLARARARGGAAVPSGESILVSAGGMTPAYCSPEQLVGGRLGRAADIWSWGLSVLEMFTGGVTWMIGAVAAEVFEAYLEKGPSRPDEVRMPPALAYFLRQCFQQEPRQRPRTMDLLADALCRIYRKELGEEYQRPLPLVPLLVGREDVVHGRLIQGRVGWRDPKEWLLEAYKAAGRPATEIEAFVPGPAVSRKAQAIADLSAYEEAARVFAHLIAAERTELRERLATLCVEKSFIHERVDDYPGALAMYDEALALYKRLVHQEGRRELADGLAETYGNKAVMLRALGDLRGAVALYNQAQVLYYRLVYRDGRRELYDGLARAYANKASALSALGNSRGANDFCRRALAIYERLIRQEGRRDLADELARTYLNKADALAEAQPELGPASPHVAVANYDLALEIYERLVHQEGLRELADELAHTYLKKANALRDLGDLRGAVALYDQALELHERLVHQEGRAELRSALADNYMNKALALGVLGDLHGAVPLHDRALALRERLVHLEGRRDLADGLARTYMIKANVLRAMGDLRGAVALYDQALAVLERLVRQEGRHELANDLAGTYQNKASTLRDLGDLRAASEAEREGALLRLGEKGRAYLVLEENTTQID